MFCTPFIIVSTWLWQFFKTFKGSYTVSSSSLSSSFFLFVFGVFAQVVLVIKLMDLRLFRSLFLSFSRLRQVTNDSQTCAIMSPVATVVKELFISSREGRRRIRPQAEAGVVGEAVVSGVVG